MKTFTAREAELIEELRQAPLETTLEMRAPCPRHSYCVPLPLFRVHRTSDEAFDAEWNDYHTKGPKQTFRFEDVV